MANSPLEWDLIDVFLVVNATTNGVGAGSGGFPVATAIGTQTKVQDCIPSVAKRDELKLGSPVSLIGSPFACLQPDLLCGCLRHGHVSNVFRMSQFKQESLDLMAMRSASSGLMGKGEHEIGSSSNTFLSSPLRSALDGIELGHDDMTAAVGLVMLDVKALPGAPV
jgi:hypothetical protein